MRTAGRKRGRQNTVFEIRIGNTCKALRSHGSFSLSGSGLPTYPRYGTYVEFNRVAGKQ